MNTHLHDSPVTIERNHFIKKSLSSFAVNFYMGCSHGCGFCSVPDTSVSKQGRLLASYGVEDPIADWGNYTLVRPWDETKFHSSLRKAQAISPIYSTPMGIVL
jgi:pyruvate-formate lyase-activating enzyme